MLPPSSLRRRLAALLCSTALGLLGCVSLGLSAPIPSDARTLDISHVVNKTAERTLELDLAKQVELTIARDGRLRPVVEGADLRLLTEIQRFQVIPLQFDAFRRPVRFKMLLAVDLELTDLRSGRQLWSTHHKIHLTPTDENHDEESFDSLNLSTLRLDQTYWGINSLGQASEDSAIVKRRLLRLAAEKIWKKIQTGFFW